jgi:hypothetical protein
MALEGTSMKEFIVITLCSMLILEGCYSFSGLNNGKDAQNIPSSEKAILVHTGDGQDIEIEPYHFVDVREPSDFVYGVGERAGKHMSRFQQFTGRLDPVDRISELHTLPDGTPVSRFIFTLPDSSIVRMDANDCVMINTAGGTGLWYVEHQWNGGKVLRNAGRIPFNNIKSIEVRQFSIANTVLCVAGTSAVVGLVILAAVASSMYNLHFGP